MISRAIDKLARLSLIDRNKLAVLFEQDHLRKLLAALKVDCVFDVGANVGQYASMLRHQAKYKGRIISFEPLSREFQELERVSNLQGHEVLSVQLVFRPDGGGYRHVCGSDEHRQQDVG